MTRTDEADLEPTAPEPPSKGRKGLAIGPFTLFLITAVALAAAGLVLWIGARSSNSGAVKVTDALDNLQGASLVPDGTTAAQVGDAAPDVTLDLLDGDSTRLSAFKGRPVVLNFWSSTCVPCLKEMPDIEQVWKSHDGKVAVVGVDVTDTEAAGRQMVAKTGVTYPNGRDPGADVFAAFSGTALPRTVFIDADGTIVAVHNGALTASEINTILSDHDLVG
ncbi:MAG TPA: TlpA disulfide reductase family protein [Microthrixaceae bacterium]|nr:TlpA disulfide reductase family protein [Microthrixaceae bacterium]